MCYEAELFLVRGAASNLMAAWVGIGLPWGIPRVFREYTERDPSIYEEWSHLSFGLRFLAGSMGMPFLPTASLLGSDLLERLPAKEMDCPLTGERLVAVPACQPEVALIHVHRADRRRQRPGLRPGLHGPRVRARGEDRDRDRRGDRDDGRDRRAPPTAP